MKSKYLSAKYLPPMLFLALIAIATSHSALADDRKFQFTNLVDITGIPLMAAHGAAYAVRTQQTVDVKVMAADLEPGHAYTVWFVFFNKPRRCATSPCGATDLVAAKGGVHFGAGGIADADGILNVEASATAGGAPRNAIFDPNLPRRGLVKGRGHSAEVHLVVVDHGVPASPDDPSAEPMPGSWAWELTHPLPPSPETDVRAAIFLPL